MGTTTVKGVPYPVDSDPPDVPKDMGLLANWNDANPGVQTMTTAQRDALPAAQKWLGRVIYNTTTSSHEGYNGTAWVPIGAGVQVLSQAQIDALPAAMKTTGMIVWNTDVIQHQFLNGAGNWCFLEVPSLTQAAIGTTPLTKFYGANLLFDSTSKVHRYSGALDFPIVGNMPRLDTATRDALPSYLKTSGQVIWNTTNLRHEWWDSAASTWKPVSQIIGGAAGNVGTISLPQSAALVKSPSWTTIGGTLTFTAVAGRRYEIIGQLMCSSGSATDLVTFQMVDQSSNILHQSMMNPPSFNYAMAPLAVFVDAGATTRQITLSFRANTAVGTAGAKFENGVLMVNDIGEAGQVSTPTTISQPDMWNGSWGVVGLASVTASGPTTTTAVVDLPNSSVTWTPVVGRRYKVTIKCLAVTDVAGAVLGVLLRDGANATVDNSSIAPVLTNVGTLTNFFTFVTPTSATPLTYKISYFRQAGGGGNVYLYADATTLTRLVIEDDGPAVSVPPSQWPPRPNPGPWLAMPFTDAGWATAAAYGPCQYRVNGDRVEFRGTASRTPTTEGSTTIATLPVGARPLSGTVSFPALCYGGMIRVDVGTDGRVAHPGSYVVGAPGFNYVNFDALWFSIAP